MHAALLLTLVTALAGPPQQTFSTDAEGFIRNWLVLAPIVIQEDAGAFEIDRDPLNGEAGIKPKAGDTAKIGGTAMTWRAHQTTDYFIDFRESFGQMRGEDAAGYAVAYVIAEEGGKATLSMGSNDQAKVWLNGQPVLTFSETRTLEKDANKADASLVKGQNVLVFKVINEKNSWQGCIRFMKDNAPLKTLKIALAPM